MTLCYILPERRGWVNMINKRSLSTGWLEYFDALKPKCLHKIRWSLSQKNSMRFPLFRTSLKHFISFLLWLQRFLFFDCLRIASTEYTYVCCFVGCCFQDLFKITGSILEYFSFNFFSMRFVCVHVVNPYCSTDASTAVRPLTSYLKNHPCKTNETCGTQLETQRRTHKWHYSIDHNSWTCQCWSTSKNFLH